MFKRVSRGLVLILLFFAIFAVGFEVGKIQVVCKFCAPEKVDFSLLWQAWDELQQKYVSSNKLDTQKLIYGAVEGMVKAVGDPHTVFFNPEDTKKFKDDVTGRFEGIGAEIGQRKGQIQVIAPLEGTPAEKAGLRAGDVILKINDTSTSDLTVDEAVNLIRGPKGVAVTLTIQRGNSDKTQDIKITRALIEVPSLKLEFKENNTVAYLHLYQFSEKLGSDFVKAANDILNSGAKKIILDLRNNPGGYLEISQEVAGWFLQRGQTVVTEDFGGKASNIIYKAEGNSNLSGYLLVVLINKGSASASEILAAALRDNRGVQLIGETSFGKGSVQELNNLQGGSTIKITVAKWLTPKGDQIDGIGLEPNVKIETTEQDYSAGKDPQLDKAIEIIKNLK